MNDLRDKYYDHISLFSKIMHTIFGYPSMHQANSLEDMTNTKEITVDWATGFANVYLKDVTYQGFEGEHIILEDSVSKSYLIDDKEQFLWDLQKTPLFLGEDVIVRFKYNHEGYSVVHVYNAEQPHRIGFKNNVLPLLE